MASLNDFLDTLLSNFSTSLKEVNKRGNKALKNSIFNELFSVAIIESKQGSKKNKERMGEAIKQTRATGLKFSNEQARQEFYERTNRVFKASDVTKLKANVKPNINKLPQLESTKVRGGFLYAARVYVKSPKRKENKTKIPYKTSVGRVINLTKDKFYFKTGKFGFWSDEILTKAQVIQIFKDELKGKKTPLVNQYVVGDTNTSDIDYSIYKPIAFLYTGLIQS